VRTSPSIAKVYGSFRSCHWAVPETHGLTVAVDTLPRPRVKTRHVVLLPSWVKVSMPEIVIGGTRRKNPVPTGPNV
jgi:hypothetical protein